MKRLVKKLLPWNLLLPLALLLLFVTQPANAQTDPTPEGYPPPATPVQPEDGYPLDRPAPSSSEAEEGYIPPATQPAVTNSPAVIGDSNPEATAVITSPISQTTQPRNRVVLWAGFLVTLLIFGLAVYGAMLMYTRARR